MAIVIEEGLHPNGMDLVMGEHRHNGVARANAVPQRPINVMPVGDGFVVAGISLEAMLSPDRDYLCAVLSVVGGRHSELVPMVPVKILLGELARVPLDQLREKLSAAIDGPKEPPPVEEAQ